jgi:hypothetical protein
MALSLSVQRDLVEWVDVGFDPPPSASFRWGGIWYCPADGHRVRESDGRVCCPACGRCLTSRLLYELIEFHMHDPVAPQDEPQAEVDG